MKKSLFYLFAIVCSMSLLTACSGDDDNGNDDGSTPVEAVVGTYGGTMDITSGGTQLADDLAKDIIVSKDASDATKAQVALNDFIFSIGGGDPVNLGNIVVDGCVVAKSGSSYTIKATKEIELQYVKKCNVQINGTVTGTKLDMTINVSALGGAVNPVVTFTGTKK